jgi:hypothetical protein
LRQFPTAALTNAIIASDDFPNIGDIGTSGFNGVTLTSGVAYILVTTGYNNNTFGVFTNTISGDGNITLAAGPVPLPAALPLFAAGLGAMGLMSRRRKRKAAVAG